MTDKKVNVFTRQAINVPNFLSFSRIFLGILVAVMIIRDYNNWIVFSITMIAVLTDFFDGFLARKYNDVTPLGKIFDPVADKIALLFICIALVYKKDFPVWLIIIIVVRDVILSSAGLFTIGKRKIVSSSNIPGKIMINVLAVLILSYILDIRIIQMYLIYLSVILIVVSFVFYCIYYYRVIFSKNTNGIPD